MVRTSIEIDDAFWRIVKIKSNKEDKTIRETLHDILRNYIDEHGEEYGYPIKKIKGR